MVVTHVQRPDKTVYPTCFQLILQGTSFAIHFYIWFLSTEAMCRENN